MNKIEQFDRSVVTHLSLKLDQLCSNKEFVLNMN